MRDTKTFIIEITILFLIIIGIVFLYNKIHYKEEYTDTYTEIEDYNNVPVVDARLGEDIRITQSYLKNYIVKKSSMWYKSSGKIKSIKNIDGVSNITVSGNNNDIKLLIDSEKMNFNEGDFVYFIGMIHFPDGYLNAAKISKENISYASSVDISLDDLSSHINNILQNYFLVSGYLVTEDTTYKLFDSKNDYENNNKAGSYFLLEFDEPFNYTGKQNVIMKCLISTTYSLKKCSLIKE